MASLNGLITNLDDDWRALRQRWLDTTAVWNDPVRWHFETDHWEPLEKQVAATRREMERLAQVMAHAKQAVK
jgi:hypothetical protein